MRRFKFPKLSHLLANPKSGFTLVELVVVIAILGILAGVGAVGYNGYIKKAEESADQQVIAAINSAFAAACLEQEVELKQVKAAEISMMNNKMNGVSKVEATDAAGADITGDDAATLEAAIAVGFAFYYQGNEETVFKTDNVNSLIWNKEKGTFDISNSVISALVVLPNGNVVRISEEDMQAIKDSSYSDLGLGGITGIMLDINESSKTLGAAAGALSLGSKVSAVMSANGFMTSQEATELGNGLNSGDEAAYLKTANGLQMVVANYVSKPGADINYLETASFPLGTISTLTDFADAGGTKTCSAIAFQYAMATACSQTEYNDDCGTNGISLTVLEKNSWGISLPKTYKFSSVSECLASQQAKDNPVEAIEAIKKSNSYKNYKADSNESGQYENDKAGFLASMNVVGKNLDEIGYDNYLSNGIEDENAQAVLGAAVGEGRNAG